MRTSVCTSKNVLQLYLIDALDDDKISVYLFSLHVYQLFVVIELAGYEKFIKYTILKPDNFFY